MKLYTCGDCHNPLYFENSTCLQCGYSVGFDPEKFRMITLGNRQGNTFSDMADTQVTYKLCSNAQYGVCNWLIPSSQSEAFCIACSLNRTIPSLDDSENRARWKNMEIAKHRLVYSLLHLNLPLHPKTPEHPEGLLFDFMADPSPDEKIVTGHAEGVITINLAEADEATRTSTKADLGEKYRTLLGHFRHEVGHYYWERLQAVPDFPPDFRALFDDENKNYTDALNHYYETGAPANWMENYISPYASAHPWEDWAETWAHYLHMMDTLETAYAFGIAIRPEQVRHVDLMKAQVKSDPYCIDDFTRIIDLWLPLTFAVNSLNRSMGHTDFYPFIIYPEVIRKLAFIHASCTRLAGVASSPA